LTEELSKDFLTGYRIGHEEAKQEFLEQGISMGVRLEHERIKSLLNMQIHWALETDRSLAPLLNHIKEEITSSYKENYDDEAIFEGFE
jgi:hypothetical protein